MAGSAQTEPAICFFESNEMTQAASSILESEFIDHPDFVVRPEYIDPNGHMNVGYYSVMFDLAMDKVRDELGIGAAALRAQGLEWFTREAHATYKRELMEGDRVRCALALLAHDGKRLHFAMSMYHAGEGWLSATYEKVAMCVKAGTNAPCPWPSGALTAIDKLEAMHRARPRPDHVGRRIDIRDAHPAGVLSADTSTVPAGLCENIPEFIRNMDFSYLSVKPEYTDANGCIGFGFFTVLVDLSMRRITSEGIGMGFKHMDRTGMTGFVAESHVTQLRKLHIGDPVAVDFQIIGLGEKVFQCMTTIRHGRDGWIAAVQEQLNMSVSLATRRPAPFHPSVRARLELALAQYRDTPEPMPRGRAVSLDQPPA